MTLPGPPIASSRSSNPRSYPDDRLHPEDRQPRRREKPQRLQRRHPPPDLDHDLDGWLPVGLDRGYINTDGGTTWTAITTAA